MSFFLLKTILASLFLAFILTAAISMLVMMGKTEKKIAPRTLRITHKISGLLSFVMLLVLLALGMKYWVGIGDQASLRAVFHAVLGLGLTIAFILKLSIVKVFRQFLRFAPGLGMLLLCLAFVVFAISAGFYSLRALSLDSAPREEVRADSSLIAGDIEKGAVLFNTKCLSCHYADSEDHKLGPGLKDLLKKEKLPYSGRPASTDNIKRQLTKPELTMPAFTKLTPQETADLIAYLKTL